MRGSSTLRQFCLKRAQSVIGQLGGTIPSTSQGQSADGNSLIDTSGVQITDMGRMSMGGGFPMGGNGIDQNLPTDESVPNNSQFSNGEVPGTIQPTNEKISPSNPSSSSVPDTGRISSPTSSGMPKTEKINAQSPISTPGIQATIAPVSTNGSERSFLESNTAFSTEAPTSLDKNSIDAASGRSDEKNPAGNWDELGFGGMREQAANPVGAFNWLLLGASAIVLLVGLFIVAFYKKSW